MSIPVPAHVGIRSELHILSLASSKAADMMTSSQHVGAGRATEAATHSTVVVEDLVVVGLRVLVLRVEIDKASGVLAIHGG